MSIVRLLGIALLSMLGVCVMQGPMANAQYYYSKQSQYRNPYTGGTVRGSTIHNPMTGRTGSTVSGFNPATGSAGRASTVSNPYTGRTASRGGYVNPYTAGGYRAVSNPYTGRAAAAGVRRR